MKSDGNMILYSWLLRWIPRLIPIIVGVVGWYLARWSGAVIGFVVGCLIAVISWATGYYFLAKARLQKRMLEISGLSDEQLKKIAINPTSRDMGLAIGELESRGLKNIRPSVESLFELLTSSDANRRALGYSQLFAIYPSIFAKIAKDGSSSSDAPEVWRERIATLNDAN
jgi:hypothetical protein